MPTKTVINAEALKNCLAALIDDCESVSRRGVAMVYFDRLFTEEQQPEWSPNKGQEYIYISSTGELKSQIWSEHKVDKERHARGNVFKDGESAEAFKSAYLEFVKGYRQGV